MVFGADGVLKKVLFYECMCGIQIVDNEQEKHVVRTSCVQWTNVILSNLWKHNTILMSPYTLPCQTYSAMRKTSEIYCLNSLF